MAGAGSAEDAALLLRDFVNTLDIDSGTEGLATPDALAGWLAERGLVPAPPEAGAPDLATAIALREGMRARMLAHHGPGDPDADDLEGALEDALAALPLRVTLTGPRPALVPAGSPASAATGLARLAAAMVDAAAAGTWTRLKVCQEDTCRWAFLDTSKNRSRSWCSMSTCGNRTKTRAYRARRRPSPGPSAGS
ncbi:CGNR zinc finger domain-containing protein [Actinomadura fibrosa]|uniref:CGNR zinc finger domain-containing protein n=1 Tax=Actinomadura fibrosa TaxID=111802 RepID=A0ABW2XPY9_9ACTN|nr:CGNR zinc finger domain-containing protein [Actinomadura fibrosa]